MKKYLKKIIIITLILVLSYSLNALAAQSQTPLTTSSIFDNGSLAQIGQGVTDEGASDTGILGVINTVIGLLQIAGTGISLIMISALGIKYILSSVEEKAEIKKSAMPIIIGAILLFGAVNIIALVEKFSGQVLNEEATQT